MHAFYQPELSKGVNFLNEDESAHCTKVLRLRVNEKILLLDGKGTIAQAKISQTKSKKVKYEILSQELVPTKPYLIHLAIAPPKNQDRLEWMVEKICEIGADKISLIQSANSEKWKVRKDRLHKKMISAIKQSQNPYLPLVDDFIPLDNFLMNRLEDQLFICYVDSQNTNTLKALAEKNKSYCVLIGPEGDFSSDEIRKAESHGFRKTSLGLNRMRSETAGLVSVTYLTLINV